MITRITGYLHSIFYIKMIETDSSSSNRTYKRILKQAHIIAADVNISKHILEHLIQNVARLKQLIQSVATLAHYNIFLILWLTTINMDYAFGKEHLLSFVYTAQWNNDNNRNNSTGDEISSSTHHSNSALHNFQLDYKLPFHLKIGAEYTHYNNPGNQTVNSLLNNEQINLYSRDRQRINKLKLSVGQEWSLPKDWTMNVGAYYISSNDHSFQHYYDVTTDTLLTGSSMSSVHREKMLNIYGGFSKSFGSKLSAEASLAAEYYHSDVWNEWNFFPTLSISYMRLPSFFKTSSRG